MPWLGDIPVLGWAVQDQHEAVAEDEPARVPHAPHRAQRRSSSPPTTIRKREEFWESSSEEGFADCRRRSGRPRPSAEAERRRGGIRGLPAVTRGNNPVRGRLIEHRGSLPAQTMMREIEERSEAASRSPAPAGSKPDLTAEDAFGVVLAATFARRRRRSGDPAAADRRRLRRQSSWPRIGRGTILLYEIHLGPFRARAAETAEDRWPPSVELSPV